MMEHSAMSITGIPFLAAMLERLAKPEQAVLDLKETEPEHEEPEAVPEEPAAPSAPSFFGQQAALKRSVYERLQACRAKGMSSVEISKLTKGWETGGGIMTEKDFELQELRRRLQFLEKENEKLTHIHQLDMAEIKYQRRQIDFLTDSLREASR